MSKPLKKITSKARKKLGFRRYRPICRLVLQWHLAWSWMELYLLWDVSLCFDFTCKHNQPFIKKILHLCHINHESQPWKFIRILRTCILVCIGELFFRANGLRAGLAMFTKMITQFTFTSFQNGTALTLGMDSKDFIIVIIAVGIVLVNSLLKEKGSNQESGSQNNVSLFVGSSITALFYLLLFLVPMVLGMFLLIRFMQISRLKGGIKSYD